MNFFRARKTKNAQWEDYLYIYISLCVGKRFTKQTLRRGVQIKEAALQSSELRHKRPPPLHILLRRRTHMQLSSEWPAFVINRVKALYRRFKTPAATPPRTTSRGVHLNLISVHAKLPDFFVFRFPLRSALVSPRPPFRMEVCVSGLSRSKLLALPSNETTKKLSNKRERGSQGRFVAFDNFFLVKLAIVFFLIWSGKN